MKRKKKERELGLSIGISQLKVKVFLCWYVFIANGGLLWLF